jgi:glutamate-1-semialdehyde 2,1-aminomutase
MRRDHAQLIDDLSMAYAKRFPRSAELQRRSTAVMVDGGSHQIRLNAPFPVRISEARGSHLTDVDGHDLLDFWQGHFTNILGHNPEVIAGALAEVFAAARGLQLGMTDELQVETAELLCERVHAEKLRFTTSGSLATMYAVMLARAFTRRDLVLKVAGGWHGAQPWGLKGVHYAAGPEPWGAESEGLPAHVADEVMLTRFNDPEDLSEQFRLHGERISCLIVEPFSGGANFILAKPEYLAAARQLTESHGALLVFDEVVSGFRFCAGDLGSLYGIRPDLVTLGKIVAGGMPLAAVAGRREVMALCGREGRVRVAFSGGTFSAHPACLLATKTMVSHLATHEAVIYPRLAMLGDQLRCAIAEAFASEDVVATCTGQPNEVVPGSSMTAVHFPYDRDTVLDGPHVTRDPALCDTVLSERVLQLALLLEDVYTLHGSLAASAAHSEADIAQLGEACRAAGQRIKRSLS